MWGPLVFLLYMNDIYLVSSCLYSIVLADATIVFLSGKDSDVLSEMMNEELCKLFKWLKANKLSLNLKKTHYILFRSKLKSVPTKKTQVKIIDECIGEVQSTKFLGVVFDCHFNWSKHINYIKTKVSKGIGIINRIKQFINKETLRTLYFSFVYPYLYYCIEVWGNAQDCYRTRLLSYRRELYVRIISCSPLLAHSEPLFLN